MLFLTTMKTVCLSERVALALALAICASVSADAEDGLGEMSGAGGIMRDAERRALAPATVGRDTPKEAKLPGAADERQAEADPADSRVLGHVSSVRFLGSAEFAESEGVGEALLYELGAGEKTMGDVKAAIMRVRRDMVGRGYYLFRMSPAKSGAYDKSTGTLTMLVDEGRFGRVRLTFADGGEEGTWFSKEQLERRFRSVEEGSTFEYSRLRSALFDANAHPDLTIDTAVGVRKSIEGEGESRRLVRYADMDLSVRESMPFHAVWELNNYGMEEVEEWQTSLTLQYLNLTKHDDVLTVSPSVSIGGEMWSVAGSYMMPHAWWNGGNTTLYGGYSNLDVDDVVPRLDLEGSGWFVGLQHSENLIDDDRRLLALSAGLLWRYTEDRYTALGYRLNERGASILPISLALSYTAKRPDAFGGRNFGTVQGLVNVVNGGDKLDELWAGADEHYWALRAQLARLQPLFGWFDQKSQLDLHQWMLFMKLEGQYTTDTLIPLEKLSLGGYNSLRGYHSRGYLGDWGVYGTFELRTPILVDAVASLFGDRTDKSPVDRLQFVGFLDWGYLAYNDLPSGYDDDEFLYSAGLGARVSMTKYTQLKCDVAFPLNDSDWAEDDDMEVYLAVQMQF